MASKPLSVVRRVRSHAIDAPVAALAGLSVAFALFAMPAELFLELAGRAGLSPADPATTASEIGGRLIAGGAGALVVFAFVFLLLRAVDRFTRPVVHFRTPEAESPRLRRRDLHPDAPAPRPIRAGREFGEPDDGLPIWLTDAEGTGAVAEPEEEQEQPEALVLEPESAPAAAAPEPRMQLGESIPALLARLEQGLADRRRTEVSADGGPSPAMPQVFPDAADARLKSAIESLQRLAARHG